MNTKTPKQPSIAKSATAKARPSAQLSLADIFPLIDFQRKTATWNVRPNWTDVQINAVGKMVCQELLNATAHNNCDQLRKCYLILRELLGVNVEELRLPVSTISPGKIWYATPFQLATLYGHLEACETMFTLALEANFPILRSGIDTPITMIKQLCERAKQTTDIHHRGAISQLARSFADRLIRVLAEQDPLELNPETGMLFQPNIRVALGQAGVLIAQSANEYRAQLESAELKQTSCESPTRPEGSSHSSRL